MFLLYHWIYYTPFVLSNSSQMIDCIFTKCVLGIRVMVAARFGSFHVQYIRCILCVSYWPLLRFVFSMCVCVNINNSNLWYRISYLINYLIIKLVQKILFKLLCGRIFLQQYLLARTSALLAYLFSSLGPRHPGESAGIQLLLFLDFID